jgi:hypothetical protein
VNLFRSDSTAELGVALLLVTLLGFFVSGFLKFAVRIERPEGVDPAIWKRVTEVEDLGTGKWVGRLEALLFVIALWANQPLIIGGWLAFKVAAKWEVWANVIQLPVDLLQDALLDFEVRHRFGGILFSRFLIGTLANLLIAGAATAVGARAEEFLGWLT